MGYFTCYILLGLSIVAFSSANNDTKVDLSSLGEPKWDRLRPGWSLTVNDQCLYEFVFQFEHDETLPMGSQNFEGECVFKDPSTKLPPVADDGLPYLDPRQFWEQFPDYVWATIGFQHLSVDWYPCGVRPRGYAKPHYGMSFFRVTPEYRAQTMVCTLNPEPDVVVPGEEVCDYQQNTIAGKNFNIIPSPLINRNLVANMPPSFNRPELGNGPVPHIGLRSWDQLAVPITPNQWEDTPVFMSSYAGDLSMWQAKIPYTRVSGSENLFTSNNYQYSEPTISTLPDTHAFHYIADDGTIRFYMVGQAGLCRSDFEKAQAAAGGVPTFPNWDDFFRNNGTMGNSSSGSGNSSSDGTTDSNNKSEGMARLPSMLSGLGCITILLLWAQW